MAAPNLIESQTVPAGSQFDRKSEPRKAMLRRPRWQPKVWHPVYEEVVMRDCMGYSNIEIAADMGYTVVHVSNILCTPQAHLIKRLVLLQMEKKRELNVDQRFDKLTKVAIDRIEETLGNDNFATRNPGGMFDRALKMLQVRGVVKDPEADRNAKTNTVIVPSDVFSRFTESMERSARERKELEGKEEIGASFTTVK